MRSRQITGNLVQLTKFGFVNAYLVREDDGLTLVDTALSKSGAAIVAAARDAGAPITRIALTHGHGDHVGSLDELAETLGDEVEIVMGDADVRIHAGDRSGVSGKLTGSWPSLTTRPRPVAGGDRIGSLQVVDSPGHSPGHVAYLDTRDATLIAGDVFTTIGGAAVSDHFQWRFPLAAMATYDKPRDRESARALRALDPAVLAVGHGPAIPNPAEAIDRALRV